MHQLTSCIDTDIYLISWLDIDTMITVSKINKSLNNIIKKNAIYQQLISYSKQNQHSIIDFSCINGYIELILYLDRFGYKFKYLHSSMALPCEPKILKWYRQLCTNLCKFSINNVKCPNNSLFHNEYGYSVCKNYECAYSEHDHNFGKYEVHKTNNKLSPQEYITVTETESFKNNKKFSNVFYEYAYCENKYFRYSNYDPDNIFFCYDSQILTIINKRDTVINNKYLVNRISDSIIEIVN